MDMGIQGKKALIAAASKGIGKATALGLAREGVDVVICSRSESNLQTTAEEIRVETGVTVQVVAADVSQAEDCQKVLEVAGAVDILINNAGGPPRGYWDQFTDDDWLNAFHLNTMSAIRLARGVLPHMEKNNWGRIVNLTSISVKQPIPDLILSNTVRAAVHGWAKSVADLVAAKSITVNNICTGMILTDRTKEGFAFAAKQSGKTEADVKAGAEAGIPMGRLGDPEELANLAVFLSSERASYITGTSILVDGGKYRGLM